MTSTDNNTSGSQLKRIPTIKDNFGLTKPDFDSYVVKLEQGDESLITKVFSTHFHDSVEYLRVRFKIDNDIAYDTCMDTMLEFRRKIISGKIQYGNLRFLFTRMALNKYVDSLRKNEKTKAAIDVFMKGYNYTSVDKQHFFDIVDKSLEEQDMETKKNIEELFYIGKHVNQLAKDAGISKGAMRKRKQRIVDKLKLSFFKILKRENNYE